MRRHIIGGRTAATIAAAVLTTVGSVLPVVGVKAAGQGTDNSCARTSRTGADALQPRDLAGACVSGVVPTVNGVAPYASRPTAAMTCITVPGVNDRCRQWMTQTNNEVAPLVATSPGNDGRLYYISGSDGGGNGAPSTLKVTAYGPTGDLLWNKTLTGEPYGHGLGYGVILPWAATLSPDGARLYVAVALSVGRAANSSCVEQESLVVAYGATTGQELWSTPADFAIPNVCTLLWTSIAADMQNVYVTGGSLTNAGVCTMETAAYDGKLGALVWHISMPRLASSMDIDPTSAPAEPVIVESRDDKMILALAYIDEIDAHAAVQTYLETFAVASATGTSQWSSRTLTSPGSQPAFRAVVDDRSLYYSTVACTASCTQTCPPAVPSLPAPVPAPAPLSCYSLTGVIEGIVVAEDLHTGRQTWSVADIGGAESDDYSSSLIPYTPWLAADPATQMVYVLGPNLLSELGPNGVWYTPGTDNEVLTAYHAADGTQAWSAPISTPTASRASLASDGAHVFMTVTVALSQGEVLSLDARTGGVAWRALLGGDADESGYFEVAQETPSIIASDAHHLFVAAQYNALGTCSSCYGQGLWAYDAS